MKTYGFGIVGCGVIADFHARSIQDLPQARLVAGAEPVEEKRKAFMEKYDCEGAADYQELVRRDDIDVVCICTPSGLHMEPAVAAAEAGKHIVCEKPIEVTLERADAIIRACTENNVRLAAIFPQRFKPMNRHLKKAIDDGRFGKLTLGDCYNKWWRSQEYYDSSGWRGTWKLDGGGACMNQAIHGVDLLQWLMGPVEKVCAFADCLAHERIEVEDTAVAILRYKNGAMGVIECTTSVHPGEGRKTEIHGDRGTVIIDDADVLKWEFADEVAEDAEIRKAFAPGRGEATQTSSDPSAFSHTSHRDQIEDLIRSLDTGEEPFVDGRSGRNAIEIITAIYRSAESGEAVQLPLS